MGDNGSGPAAAILEREHELARIREALEDARAGRGSVLLVEGPPGIGKTTLMRFAREQAQARGMWALTARASELERDYPYGVVRQLLEPVLRSARGERRARLLEGAGVALAALAPEIEGDTPGTAADFATLNGLWWLLSNLAEERPVTVVVDDAHWADRASLRLVEFLEPRLPEVPVLVLAAARASAIDTAGVLAATASNAALSSVALSPLSPGASAALVRARFAQPADGAFCLACHQATGGNPFYLHALLDELARDRVPPAAAVAERVLQLRPRAVTRAILGRLATLPPPAVTVCRALAILGDDARLSDLAALAGLDLTAAADGARRLARAAIITQEERPRFIHPIVRNAVYSGITAAERDRLHRQAAELLDHRGALPEQVAAHLLACRPGADPAVVGTLEAAARQATARGSSDSAGAYLCRALEETSTPADRRRLLLEAGSAELLTDGAAAVEHLGAAFAGAADARERTHVGALLVRALLFVRRLPEALATATTILDDAETLDAEAAHELEAIALLATVLDATAAPQRDAVLARIAVDGGDDGLGSRQLLGVLALDRSRRLTAPAAEVSRQARRALSGGALLEQDNAGVGFVAAVVALALADPDLPLRWLNASLEQARAQGDIFARATSLILRGWVLMERGELAAARVDGDEGLEAARRWGVALVEPWGYGYLAATQLDQGDLAAARRTLDSALAPGQQPPHTTCWLPYLDARARLLALLDEPRASLEVALECGRRAEAAGPRNPAFIPWRSRAAAALARLGEDPARARQLAAEEVELARRWGAPRPLGQALRVQALVTGPTAGEQSLREAVEVLSDSSARLEQARTLVQLGELIRRGGRRADARPPLRQGLDLARASGATGLAERAYQELRATGASPRKLIRTGVDMLTASERRVAHLAATGKSNKQIAQELYVTVKTVETHLAQAYRKLDISSRVHLTAALEADDGSRRLDRLTA